MSDFNWYVVHTYSGYENKVKADIEKTIDKFSKCALITYNKNAEVDKVIFYKEKLKENM